MNIQHVTELSELILHRDSWNTLAGDIPHMRFEWMVTWWRFFGGRQQLLVLCVRDDEDNICGYAPWFIDTHRGQGPTIRFLGSGKACGDHLSILCDPRQSQEVVAAIAEHLFESAEQWQHLELVGGDADDIVLKQLCDELSARDLLVHRRQGLACFLVKMPHDWDTYLQQRSKPTRRKLRRHLERCHSEDFEITVCSDREAITENWPHLIELHQKRRQTLDHDGCFTNTVFGDFLLSATLELADANMVELTVLSYLSQPVALELCFISATTTYYYQSGMDPDLQGHAPGVMLLAYTAWRSVGRGAKCLDLLRGEEPYKIRWRGERVETVEIRAASTAWQARLRQQAWQAGAALKDWLKSSPFLAPPAPESPSTHR